MATDKPDTLPLEEAKPKQTTAITDKPKFEAKEIVKKEKFTPELCASTIGKLPAQLQGLKNCFAQPFDSFRNAYSDPREADRIMAREIKFAAQAMMANTYLINYATKNPLSLINALENVALTNSTLNPVLKQGYLVPFKGNITFMPSYMGLADVLVNNGLVRKVEAHPVFEGEEFSIQFGTNAGLYHQPNPWGKREKESLKGVYYFVVLIDGTEMYDTLSFEEIETIRKRAPSSSSDKTTPWDTDYIEMAKKSAVRRAFKMIPKNGISENKLKALEAVFDYDEKVEQDWIKSLKEPKTKKDTFDEEVTEYEEV